MQNIAKRLLGTNADTVMDLVSVRARRDDAARKLAQGATEQERLAADVDRLRLQRARLLEQRDSEIGVDLFVPIRKVEGELAAAGQCRDAYCINKASRTGSSAGANAFAFSCTRSGP